MASIKCRACGHRNLNATVVRLCTNCGSELASLFAGYERDGEMDESPSALPTTMQQAAHAPRSISLPARHTAMPPLPSVGLRRGALGKELAPLPSDAPPSQLPAGRFRRGLQPYQSSVPDTVLPLHASVQPFADSPPAYRDRAGIPLRTDPDPFQTIVTEEHAVPREAEEEREEWQRERLPFGYPRRPPEIFGTLIHVQTQQEQMHSGGMLSAIARQFMDAIWATPGSMSATKEREHQTMNTLRIRTATGARVDARLMGDLTGANLTIGDTISLWGRKRRGTLLISHAYNHTTKSAVTTRAMVSHVGFFLVLLFLVLLFLWVMHIITVPFLPEFPHIMR